MKILLVHQNFPGQFRQLAPYLSSLGHEVVAVAGHDRPIGCNFRVLRYQSPPKIEVQLPYFTLLANEAFIRAEKVARLCYQLSSENWHPDCVCAHSGWGESLAIKEVWPDVPHVLWPELWLRPEHGGWGFDPQKGTPGLDQRLEHTGRNTLTSAALAQSSAWILPTRHQANSLPDCFQDSRLHVVHEGIDTQLARPNPDVQFVVRGVAISRQVPTITFVNRNLERLRGFDVFMESLPIIMTHNPSVRVLIVGDNESGYGGAHPTGQPIKEVMLKKLEGKIDLNMIHFLGRIPHPSLIALLQASWVHVYLTYPFVLGWSLLEAMACGCSIVASRGMPVEEVIRHEAEGLLVSINDPTEIAENVLRLLYDESLRHRLSRNARAEACRWDQSLTLPQQLQVIKSVVGG